MKNVRIPGTFLAVLALTPLAGQQAPPRPAEIGDDLDELLNTDMIQAASKRIQEVASAPADVVVLRGSELRSQGYRTLGDALGGVLGFVTNADHAYQGMGMAGVYTLGDQNTRLLVLLDGHALNSPAEVGSSKVGEDFGLPLELVDRIEIVRGPASSLYGNNAFQALVNVSSTFAAGSANAAFQGAATGGTDGVGELWAAGSLPVQGATANLMVSGFRRTGTALTLPELQAGALPAAADGETRQSAYLYVKGAEWSFAGSLASRLQRLASGPYGAIAGATENYYLNRRMAADFKWEPRTDQIHWLFRLFGDRNSFSDRFITGSVAQADHQTDVDPDRSLGLEAQGRATLSPHFTLTFGTEWQQHRYDGLYLDDQGGASVETEVSYRIGNTYLEGNWEPSPTWNVVAGLQRADWLPGQVRNTIGGLGQDQAKATISRLTPRLSLIWKPAHGEVVKAIFGQGFRFPTIFERYYTDDATQAANPAIKPEVLTSGQLSWSKAWNPRFSTQVAVSAFTWQHAIIPGSLGDLEQYQNADGDKDGKAVEAESTWRNGGTELSGGLGWYQWTYQGTTLDNASRWLGNLKAVQHLGAWSLAGEARYVDGRQALSMATGMPAIAAVPANWTLRASLRRESAGFWCQATVEDLTNSRRRDLVAPEYAPVTWMPADGRAVRIVVGFRR